MKDQLFSYRRTSVFLFLFGFTLALSCIVGAKAFAATYYINNNVSCSDSYVGTAQTSGGGNGPWCNISNVSGKSFSGGDSILLARGATWTSQAMEFTESGSSGNPITIDAYGSGDRPIIQGTSQVTDRAITLQNASYWNIGNLEIGHVGTGILFNYTTISHEDINLYNIYVHHVTGIVRGSPSNSDNIYFSAGIEFTGAGMSVDVNDYVIRNVSMDYIEGTHNQDSISFNWNNGSSLVSYNGETSVQNAVLNHLYLHDNDGHDGSYQSSSCGALGFTYVSDSVLMNSVLDHEASCYAPLGTAAIFTAFTKNLQLINNVIVNVPETGSPDETGLDMEIQNDSMKFYGNYIGGNAGAGVSMLLINGALYDWETNHEFSGNIFDGNGNNGALRAVNNGGGVLKIQGNASDNIYQGSPFTNTVDGGTFDDFTFSNNIEVSNASDIYNSPVGYSSTQGSNQWFYQLYNGSSYSNLSYDSANQWWGSSTGNVSKFEGLPNSTSSNWVARAWKAPSDGTISIRGRALKSDIAGGDGVKVRITKNGSVIWPTGGTPQTIAYNDRSGYNTFLDSISVSEDDVIRFEINNGGSADSSHDATSWAPTVTYTSAGGGSGSGVYQASTGFSSSQGGSNWSYQSYNGSTYSNMIWDSANSRWYVSGYYCIVTSTTQHPDNTDSVRTFTAPGSGSITITGSVFKADPNGGDGVRVKIMKNGTQIWPSSGWQTIAYNDATGYSVNVNTTVAANDQIHFIVDQNGTNNDDSTYWDPVITYSGGGGGGDTTAPDAISDLAVVSTTSGSANLTWTAPGDDGSTGTAASYDVRYSTSPINSGNWASASQASGAPTPSSAGSSESFTVSGLSSSTTYYFAIKTSDEVPNTSTVSNSPSGTTSSSGGSYQASTGFSGTQGANNWSYQSYDGSTYTNMIWDSGNNRWYVSGYYCIVTDSTQHPDNTDSVRTFTAPSAGTITITGSVFKADTLGGDGVRVKIMKNNTQIWPASGWQTIAYNDSTGYYVNVNTTVAVNDQIHFIVDQNGTVNDDSTYWNPAITY